MKPGRHPPFLVVSLHPAIDRTIEIPELRRSPLIRGRLLRVEAGGKAINIAHSLANLGHSLTATGFMAESDAGFFLRSLAANRAKSNFIKVDGLTRENITLVERRSGRDIHILSGRMVVRRNDIARLSNIVKSAAHEGLWAVFSGSRPEGMTLADFQRLLRHCSGKGSRLVVDASGEMLRTALRARPWLVKPNRDELSEVSGRRLDSLTKVVAAARRLRRRSENVLVSLGRGGAVLVGREGAWRAWEMTPPKSVISVGCGDALLAGFLSAQSRGESAEESLRFAVACGSACARSDYACIRRIGEPRRFLSRIRLASL